jgi:hypothetical protein
MNELGVFGLLQNFNVHGKKGIGVSFFRVVFMAREFVRIGSRY